MIQNKTHLLIDMETLGTRPNSVILSLACVQFTLDSMCEFDDLVKSGFYIKFDSIEQIKKYKRNVEVDTMEWWRKQGDSAKSITKPSKHDVSVEQGLRLFSKFVGTTQYSYNNSFVWSRGIAFDGPILTSLYDNVANTISMPINTWMLRDVRTFVDVLESSIDGFGRYKDLGIPTAVTHNALHDVCMDVMRIQKIYAGIME